MLVILLICNVGCSPNNTSVPELIETKEIVTQIEGLESMYDFSQDEWMNFFKAYFSFTQEELLILNQRRELIDEAYWSQLRQYYEPLIQSKLGMYLEEDLAIRLQKEYVFDEITLPSWVLINQYIVEGEAKVEGIEMLSARALGEDMVYEVSVTTVNKCKPVSEFTEEYTWGEKEGYFIRKEIGQGYPLLSFYNPYLEVMSHQSYLYSSKEDEMKLKQHFWITVSQEKPLKIKSIHHAEEWERHQNEYKMVLGSKYITRIPYKEQVSPEEKNLLQKVFETLMTIDKSFYEYYEKAYATNVDVFRRMWEDIGLGDQMEIQEIDYREAFPTSILPYKDEINRLTISPQGISFKPSVYSTKQQPRYVVTIPVEALLNTNQTVYYTYNYFIGMENKKIEFIQFLSIDEIESEDYTGV